MSRTKVAQASQNHHRKQPFHWALTQDEVQLLAVALYKLQTIIDVATPGCASASDAARLLNDLRAQCVAGGLSDPFPGMAFSPRFADTIVPASSLDIWGDGRSLPPQVTQVAA